MKQAGDTKTGDLLEHKRGRGRPPLADAKSAAERARLYRARKKEGQQPINRDDTENHAVAARLTLTQIALERNYLREEVERLHNENDKLQAELRHEASLHAITLKGLVVAKDRIAVLEGVK
jgi:hypothetical protein